MRVHYVGIDTEHHGGCASHCSHYNKECLLNRRRFATSLAFTAAAPALLPLRKVLGQVEGIPVEAQEAAFVEAVDGEKMKVKIGDKEETVRFIGIDAPEEKNDDDFPECGFEESKQALTEAVSGRRIFLESDVEDKDGKKCLWRNVWTVTPEGASGGLLNEQLLQFGWATRHTEEKT